MSVIAVEGDRLVPMADAVALIEGLGTRGRLRVLRSPYGHDAFLKEIDRVDALLATELFGPGGDVHFKAHSNEISGAVA